MLAFSFVLKYILHHEFTHYIIINNFTEEVKLWRIAEDVLRLIVDVVEYLSQKRSLQKSGESGQNTEEKGDVTNE